MIETVNSDFRDVDWDSLDLHPDYALVDIPFEVFSVQSGNPYSSRGRMGQIEQYEDADFDIESLAETHREVLPDDGLALICHAPQQTERVVEAHRDVGFWAQYGHDITLHFDASGQKGMGAVYTTKRIASNKYTVTIAEGPDHEWDYEYVLNCIDYPRKKRPVDWHPCPMHKGTVRYFMEKFGGECWLDLCAGTGTVGLVAQELGVDAVLVEQDDDYYDRMVDRVESYRSVAPGHKW